MGAIDWQRITDENRELLEFARERNNLWKTDPGRLFFFPFAPCNVRALLVTDGGLDFGASGFGLRTFVLTLQHTPYYVSYEITLAHRGFRNGDAMMEGDGSIGRRIVNFRFDNTDHFAVDMYDEVWLFGIESAPGIAETELRAISEYMNGGGGLFATGDHGSLGKAMGAEIPRARSMRLWESTSLNVEVDEVSMSGRRRNDTNRLGHDPDSQFNDQSDDVPQRITPKLYRVPVPPVWRAVFPHPILCGPRGMITVAPDHPHEGECVEPDDLGRSFTFSGASFEEYPAGVGGSPRPVPEVISTSTVLAGTTSGRDGSEKTPTDPHTFGGICTYDGHRASVGRVVTDATWHHFVNVNFVGELGAAPPKDVGFLATAEGVSHMEDIKTYHRNIAVWIARPELIRCMNRRILWQTIFDGRVVEALATAYEIRFHQADIKLFWDIGKHARDVLGRATSTCQGRQLIIGLFEDLIDPGLLVRLDPWWPGPPPDPDPIPWFDPTPVLDAALGGAIMALRDEFLDVDPRKVDRVEEAFDDIARRGVEAAVRETLRDAAEAAERFIRLVTGSK